MKEVLPIDTRKITSITLAFEDGSDHVMKGSPRICFCGKKGIYWSHGRSFCSLHKDHAIKRAKAGMQRYDKSRRIWVE